MIVRHFLHWMNAAPAAERGDASAALARACLYSDMSADDRAAAEGALIMLLDDPSPLVRAELARALAFSDEAPPAVILGLAADQPEIASWVLEHSPLLLDTDLVELIAARRVHSATRHRETHEPAMRGLGGFGRGRERRSLSCAA
jgi:uncharacterized protein (DUF2336 family)